MRLSTTPCIASGSSRAGEEDVVLRDRKAIGCVDRERTRRFIREVVTVGTPRRPSDEPQGVAMAHFQLDDEDLSSYAGPTPWCNWVIKGKVMAGGYPACMDDDENDELLVMLMRDVGVDCFVCLQSEVRQTDRFSHRRNKQHTGPRESPRILPVER